MTISTTKSQVVFREVPINMIQCDSEIEDASLSIEIYFQLKPLLSMLLNYMTLNFGVLTSLPIQSQLPLSNQHLVRVKA